MKKLKKSIKWAIAAVVTVATVATTVSIANAYTIDKDTNSSHEINIINNSNGYLWYDTEENLIYVTSYRGGAIDGGYISVEGDRLNISSCGYFNYIDGRGGQWQGGGSGSNWDGEDREAIGSDAHLYAFSLRERTSFRGDKLNKLNRVVYFIAEHTDFRRDRLIEAAESSQSAAESTQTDILYIFPRCRCLYQAPLLSLATRKG